MIKDPRVYLAHILECIEKIERFTKEGRSRFFHDVMVQDAVLRNFEVIGEAAKRLDDAYRAERQEIPWRSLAGLWDVLIHQYDSVDLEHVWAIVEGDLPGLREAIAVLLPPLKINDRARQRITKGIGAPGDVLLSHKGTVGKVALIPQDAPPFVCSPQTTFWRTLDAGRLDCRYLYAFLRSPEFRDQLGTRSGETDMAPYVSLTSQRGLSVTLPPIAEQRAIAHILGTLDDKIELNRQMSETLEAMARALFQSWFVAFDPVLTKVEGHDLGLPKHLADLFSDRLMDSELGEIPEGWETRSLDQIANFLNGLALQKYPPRDGRTLPVIKIAQLRAGHTLGADLASSDLNPDYVVDDGDVLFSWSGSLECMLWTGGRGALNQHLFKVTSSSYPKWFYYFWIHEHLS